MSLHKNSFKLADGNTIPAIAYGTGTKWFKLGRNEVDQNLVKNLKLAVKEGFTHIDGAEVYNTDPEIGEALASLDRSKLFITNKFSSGNANHDVFSPHGKPYTSLKTQLAKELKISNVDLYLLHSPFIAKESHGFDLKEAWKSMEQAVEEGLTKSIGVSNFAVDDLKEILSIAKVKPVVNQIEFSAYLQDQTPGIVEFCQQNNILVEAYSSLGPLTKGEPGELHEYVKQLGSKYNKTPEQIILRWVLERNILPVTTTSNETRMSQFLDVFDFELGAAEIAKINTIGAEHPTLRQYWLPEYSKYNH